MVEEILRKHVENKKAWKDYVNEFKDWDDGLKDAVGIRLSINDDISEFKDFEQEKQEPDAIPLVIPYSKGILTHESHVIKNNRDKNAVSKEARPFRIFVKNKSRYERIAKLQGNNFKFDEFGTGSTPEKAF
uniref:Uncharacterized protein n=1 Tax=Tanacetum cinerariifolium TaxID=118510 RepID=A0A6L2JZL3_TANCI|nr:hypothetical protein [Tanacetum cinerariifolium]